MLLRYKGGKLHLLEATTNGGVKIVRWSSAGAKGYRLVVYRRLLYKVPLQTMCAFEEFLKASLSAHNRKL